MFLVTIPGIFWSIRIIPDFFKSIFFGVHQSELVFSLLADGLESVKAVDVIWQVEIGMNFHHNLNTGNLELVLCYGLNGFKHINDCDKEGEIIELNSVNNLLGGRNKNFSLTHSLKYYYSHAFAPFSGKSLNHEIQFHWKPLIFMLKYSCVSGWGDQGRKYLHNVVEQMF